MAKILFALIAFAAVSASGGQTIVLGPPESASATIHLKLEGGRRWPTETHLALREAQSGASYSTELSPAAAADLATIRTPDGHLTLEIAAAHHRLVRRDVTVEHGGETHLGVITLEALPLARGKVLAYGKPVVGAVVGDPGRRFGQTQPDGTFEIEIPEPRPKHLTVSAAGFGTKNVALSSGRADVVIPTVDLVREASLAVRVRGARGPLDIAVQQEIDDDQQIVVAHRKASATSTLFEHLDAGVYTVVAAGSEPLERYGTRIRVGEGKRATATIRVIPHVIAGRVRWGGRPLGGVTLQFRNERFGWTSRLTVGGDGHFVSRLWQPGDFSVGVWRGPLSNLSAHRLSLGDGDVVIDVPAHSIRGRVVDAANGRPVPGAHLRLVTRAHEMTATVPQAADAEGRFSFNALMEPRGTLSVVAENYLLPDPIEIGAAAAAPVDQNLVIRLDSGRRWDARVFDDRGNPVFRADVIGSSGNRYRSIARTDSTGRVTVPLPDDAVTVYVMAPGGGFAVVNRFDHERVDVPAPSASLQLVARSTLGKPMPHVSLIMSVNGWTIPPHVAERLGHIQGFSLQTNEQGEINLPAVPPGLYQFWPYDGDDEAEAILLAPPEPPISVQVKAGPNAVAVDFQQH